MVFVDWPENVAIGARGPQEYWPSMTKSMPADKIERQRYWHALPTDREQIDYPTLLNRRRKLIAESTKGIVRALTTSIRPSLA